MPLWMYLLGSYILVGEDIVVPYDRMIITLQVPQSTQHKHFFVHFFINKQNRLVSKITNFHHQGNTLKNTIKNINNINACKIKQNNTHKRANNNNK